MTDEWIEESNELIAKFMGIEPDEDGYLPMHECMDYVFTGDTGTYYYEATVMHYHESWDWIMPVTKKVCDTIEKLLDLDDENTDDNYEADLMGFYSTFVEINFFKITIKDIYMQCVSFINWYNDNK